MNSKHFTLDLLSSFQIKHYFGPLVQSVTALKEVNIAHKKDRSLLASLLKLLSRNHSKFLKHFVYGDRPA